MKIVTIRWIQFLIFILAAIGIVACSPKVSQIRDAEVVQPPSVPHLTNIEIVDLPNTTRILLEAAEVLKYTSFTLSDPPRLVIDLSDISLGEFKEPIKVNKGSVIEIYPIETDMLEAGMPSRVARLYVRLINDSVESKIYTKENNLVIDVLKEGVSNNEQGGAEENPEVITQEPEAPSEKPEPEKIKEPEEIKPDDVTGPSPEEEEIKGAEEEKVPNIIKDIKVESFDDRTNIVISADDDIDAETFMVEDNRIVVDIKEAIYPAPVQKIQVGNNSPISKVRVGRHTTPVRKVRIVADLKEKATYEVSKGERALVLSVQAKDKRRSPENIVFETKVPSSKDSIQISAEKSLPEPAEKSKAVSFRETVTPSAVSPKYSGKRVSLDFQDADIINVLRLLAEVSKLNMVIGDNVKGKITIKMLDVPWDQALDVILKMKGLGKVYEDNVLRVDTLSNIAQQQEEEAKAKEAMVKAEDLVTRILSVNYARAKDVAESIKKSLSVRGDITVDDRTNTLIIKEIEDKHEEIGKLLKTLDKPTPQVLIEARIVQADSNFAKDLGIQWGGSYSSNPGDYNIGVQSGPGGTTVGAPTTGFAVNLPAAGVAGTKGSMGFTIGKTVGDAFNLDLRLSAGEAKGLTKVLSAPKIATLDNKEATIQQGESIPYKTVSQTGTKTEFIDATLTLKVTPKVTPDGHISMNIKITKNRQGSIVVEGTPSINKKEATTEVLVKDGETTVIGGIYELTDVDNLLGVPWFHQVPILGWLFKSTQKSNIKSELLIFITPKIIPVTT